jgi:hypothetical protein
VTARKLIRSGAIATVILYFWVGPCRPEVIYPIVSSEKALKDLVRRLNKQKIRVAKFSLEESGWEAVKFDPGSFTFTIEEIGGGRFTFYRMDINNDRHDEYVLTEKGDLGSWFDIAAVYQEDKAGLRDIYEEVKLPLRAFLREAQHASYNLEEGFVGISHGDMIVEKEDGKIYFSLVESHGTWLYCPPGKNARCRWVRENYPQVHKFLWEKDKILLVKTYKRRIGPEDFRKIVKRP